MQRRNRTVSNSYHSRVLHNYAVMFNHTHGKYEASVLENSSASKLRFAGHFTTATEAAEVCRQISPVRWMKVSYEIDEMFAFGFVLFRFVSISPYFLEIEILSIKNDVLLALFG